MEVIAKFSVTKSAEFGYSGKRQEIQKLVEETPNSRKYESTGIPYREITMSAVCGDGTAENTSFAGATPTGTITFTLSNPACAEEFKPGQYYYVKFIPCE